MTRDEPPALASIRLASGQTAYVELSPEGRRRIAGREGTVVRLFNSDVAERHRHDEGIVGMSLDRLTRLRKAEENVVTEPIPEPPEVERLENPEEKITLPSGRVIDRATYHRFAGLLESTLAAGPGKKEAPAVRRPRRQRWNGVDGVDARTRAPWWGVGVRHGLADAARGYDWPRVLGILGEHPECVNASRPGGRTRYAPLHQAAHGGAPAAVVRRLLAMGAWRTLRTRRGERAVDVARRRGHRGLIPLLTPVCRRRVPLDALQRMQRHFHAVIRERPPGRAPSLRLPELEPLLETDRGERVFFEVPGMFGGFEYRLADDGIVPRLLVETFRRIIGYDLRYEVTPRGWRLVEDFRR